MNADFLICELNQLDQAIQPFINWFAVRKGIMSNWFRIYFTFEKITIMQYRLICLLAISVCLFSCNKIPNHAKYIPKDAQLVGCIDMNKMGKKLIWNALTGSELFAEMQKNMKNEDTKMAMKDISNIGLDQNSSIYFYINGKRAQEGSTCLVVGMKDASKFETFIKKTYPDLVFEKGQGYTKALIENSILAAWNKEVALFYPLIQSNTNGMMNFSMNNLSAIQSQLKENFSRSKANSILSNDHFKTLQNNGHDMSIWMNYEELYNQNADPSSNPFIKQEYFKEAGLATGLDFEKGKVNAVMDYYMGAEMATIYKKFEPQSIDLSMAEKLPSDDIAVLFGYNLNPQLLQEYLKKFGLDGLLNMGLGLAGTSMDNISSTFKGDMIFALSDMKINETDSSQTHQNITSAPDMNMTLAMTIKDQQGLEKLLGIGVKNKILIKKGNGYSLPDSNQKSGFLYNKKYMVYSSDAMMANRFIEGKSNSNKSYPSSVWKHFSSSPMIFFMDIKKVLQVVKTEPQNQEETEFINQARNFFTYMEMYGGKIKNNAVHVEGGLFLTNEKENALIQLLDLGMKAKKLNDNKQIETNQVDSLLVQ